MGELWGAVPPSCPMGRAVSAGWGTVLVVGAGRPVCPCLLSKRKAGSCVPLAQAGSLLGLTQPWPSHVGREKATGRARGVGVPEVVPGGSCRGVLCRAGRSW